MKRLWVSLPTRVGSPESSAMSMPLKGPYIYIKQGQIVAKNWEAAARLCGTSDIYKLRWGEEIYQEGENGETELCGYWYDSSD